LENKIEKEFYNETRTSNIYNGKKKFSFLGREYSPNFGRARYATLEKYQFPNTLNMNVWQ